MRKIIKWITCPIWFILIFCGLVISGFGEGMMNFGAFLGDFVLDNDGDYL